jgi:hypothetical protein
VEISYTVPLRRAWQRMQAMLFHPFLLERWLVVGFAAFLANLLGTGGGLFSWNNRFSPGHAASPRVRHVLEALHDHVVTLLEKPAVLLAIAAGLVVLGIVLLVFMWASARARFVFLENVVTGRSAFVDPWSRYGRLGRSLFLWYAAFSFTWLLPLGALAFAFAHTIGNALRGMEYAQTSFNSMVLGGVTAALLALVLGFVSFLTRQFVVPLMLMYDEGVSRAWGRFWPLLAGHLGDFVAYALFLVVVWVVVGVVLAVAGVATCCIGLVLMMIPYVGTVLLLPVEVTARAYGPEFLAQYGPEWDLFAARAPRESEPVGPLPG